MLLLFVCCFFLLDGRCDIKLDMVCHTAGLQFSMLCNEISVVVSWFYLMYITTHAGFTDWKENGVKGIRPVMMRFFLAVQVNVLMFACILSHVLLLRSSVL